MNTQNNKEHNHNEKEHKHQALEIEKHDQSDISLIFEAESSEIRKAKIKKNMKKLSIAIGICLVFMTAELVGGYMAQSLAIMTDAAHLLSDVLGYVISIFGLWLSLRSSDKNLTYGYARADVLGAIGSVMIIWGLTGFLLYEAYQRLINQDYEIDAIIMCITAVFGLICNLVMAKVIDPESAQQQEPPVKISDKKQGQEALLDKQGNENQTIKTDFQNVNMKAAAIHILGDIIQSIGVIIAALIIYFQPSWKIADPICTILFATIVLFTTSGIIRECITVIMEGLPADFDLQQFEMDLNNVKGVEQVINLHVWQISIGKLCMSCRIKSYEPTQTLFRATKLCFKYGIMHPTIQVEDLNNDNEQLNQLLEHSFH